MLGLINQHFYSQEFIYSSYTTESFLTFAINNTLELKFKSDEDTVTGFKKGDMDQFSIVGNYNFKRFYEIVKYYLCELALKTISILWQ